VACLVRMVVTDARKSGLSIWPRSETGISEPTAESGARLPLFDGTKLSRRQTLRRTTMKLLEQHGRMIAAITGLLFMGAAFWYALSSHSARRVGLSLLTLMAVGVMTAKSAAADSGETGVRPFRANVAASDLADLRRRLTATRWPDKETVEDDAQGAQLAKLQKLVGYWGSDYDWRRAEASLNAYPQFVTKIDGVDIHFIHVRSRHPNALPVLIAHGWPGSIFEQLKLIGPLTDPTKHGGRADQAFDVVIPSLPGFGFSGRPTEPGWSLERIGRAFDILMKRVDYAHYVAQGGDWGAGIVQAMGRQAPTGLLGVHTNLPAALPDEVGPALGGGPLPPGMSGEETAVVEALQAFGQSGGLAYVTMMNARPQAVGYGITDSPAGLAGWLLVHPGFEKWSYGEDLKQSPTRDDVLDDITLYWLTNSAASSARLYWENRGRDLISSSAQKTQEIHLPVAVSVFPDEVYLPPETWVKRAFPNLVYYRRAERGGHFAAWEHPKLFASELRAAFHSLRRTP
jgi:pimeloyl-ACP methyl ester carboxylesterase